MFSSASYVSFYLYIKFNKSNEQEQINLFTIYTQRNRIAHYNLTVKVK